MLLKLSNILKQCDNTSWIWGIILVDKPFKQRFQKYFSNKHEKGYTYVSVFLPSAAEFKKTRTVLAGISCISSIRTCPESNFLVASSIFFFFLSFLFLRATVHRLWSFMTIFHLHQSSTVVRQSLYCVSRRVDIFLDY